MLIEETHLGCAPRGLLEKSREHVQHICIFGCSKYDEYLMVNGVSRYAGSVDYSRITVQ
jgi:hypothetical protein